ncbi:hypothetical protein [Hoeflea sp.]|uniref:polysaccharide deacetylase WbmS family protein n=1 Tax=Hoeflea sp. TaxID=1940281 RepID=UPI003A9513BD
MCAITLDVDWAPDFVIDDVANLLIEAGVRAVWFVTHDSPAVRRLRTYPELFEIGIHPNFLPGSTHGNSESEVLAHCMSIVPEARMVRTHGLVQTSNLLQRIVAETPVQVDLSLFLPHARNVEPVTYYWEGGETLHRIPYVWEDDFEIVRPNPDWELSGIMKGNSGLVILDFHPIHVYLNSNSLQPYRIIRALGNLTSVTKSQVDAVVCTGIGVRSAFIRAIEFIRAAPGPSLLELGIAGSVESPDG